MIMQFGSGKEIADPTVEDLQDALRSLDGSGDAFLVLEEDPVTRNFMQVAGDGENFTVEFAEVDDGAHWATEEDVPFETALNLLRCYHEGDESYKTSVKWKALDLSPSGCMGVVLLVIALATCCFIA